MGLTQHGFKQSPALDAGLFFRLNTVRTRTLLLRRLRWELRSLRLKTLILAAVRR